PGVLETDMRRTGKQVAPPRSHQVSEVPPERLGATPVHIRRSQDGDQPRSLTHPGTLPAGYQDDDEDDKRHGDDPTQDDWEGGRDEMPPLPRRSAKRPGRVNKETTDGAPRPAPSRNCCSPVESRKALARAGRVWGAWRRSTWVAALATTAWPSSVASRSAASWVTTVRPHQCLRADLARRNRKRAPASSRM